jgi:hypothetical protein
MNNHKVRYFDLLEIPDETFIALRQNSTLRRKGTRVSPCYTELHGGNTEIHKEN